VSGCYIFTLRCFEQGFTFPVAELFLEDVLEKTRYRINSERDNFAGSSRRKRFSSVKSDPLSDVFEVNFDFELLFPSISQLSTDEHGLV
jgi:hypothetical protein